jgi:precorrin-8X/cobalt-precorrin-8 methylmutase
MRPEEIEQESMKTIKREMGKWNGSEGELPVVMRVIHATADFDFKDNLRFSENAVDAAREALSSGCTLVTDTKMAAAGVNMLAASRFGVEAVCRMSDICVREAAKARGVTRAVVSIEEAVKRTPEAIFAIGNAPTALIRLCELIDEGKARPRLVIGVPVGFVNVIESKERLVKTNVPYIAAMGRKGGSAVACAIVNALLYGIN